MEAARPPRAALKKSQITGYQDVAGNEQALAEAVSQGPVSVAVCAITIFQFYNKGVVTSNLCGAMLDHGVLAVGYGTDSGTKYWKVKNSWGKSWGENGYIHVETGKKVGFEKVNMMIDATPTLRRPLRRQMKSLPGRQRQRL